jgi:hypothetical protein
LGIGGSSSGQAMDWAWGARATGGMRQLLIARGRIVAATLR